ncbi:hypothetical protein OHA21_14085 [Actinoplanes sp. NBC_00393]|uniref:hypothetical protein n=1 Tax=Actinoplanes sp. NBC_00393 TaxID=2975953 RepID=UPI002E23BA3B
MRPRLINHTAGRHAAITPTATGWAAIHQNPGTVRVYDPHLDTITTIPAPDRRTQITADTQHIAISSTHGLTVTTHDGTTRWHRTWTETGETHPNTWSTPHCHLADGTLWTHLQNAAQIITYDPATGRELDRHALPDAGNGWFVEHPHQDALALNIVVCPIDHQQAWQLRLDNGRISAHRLPDAGYLAGFLPGNRYFSTGPDGLAVQHADGHDQIRRDVDDLPDSEPGRHLSEAAVVIPDSHILIAVSTEEDHGYEQHLLLSADLRYHSTVEYPQPRKRNSLRAASGHGRWLTYDDTRGVLELWELDGHLDEHGIPGQLSLFP